VTAKAVAEQRVDVGFCNEVSNPPRSRSATRKRGGG
jgi:hypothetical protein